MRSTPTWRLADHSHREGAEPGEGPSGADGPPNARGDNALLQDVRAELALTAAGDTGSVFIAVRDGVVYLSGFTDCYGHKLACERAVGRIFGVKGLRDHLEVHPADGCGRDDRRIEQAARRAHAWDARVPDGVRARVTDGVLRLEGTVGGFAEREAAEAAVRNLRGLRDIVNEIKLAPARVPDDLERQVAAALRRRFRADAAAIAIAAASGVVTLRGVVSVLAVIDELERAVLSIPGVQRVDALLLVGAVPEASAHGGSAVFQSGSAVSFHGDVHDGPTRVA